MISDFNATYAYVNERYVFSGENYPDLKTLSPSQALRFKLNHGLLHILKSFKKIGGMPYEKQKLGELNYLATPNQHLWGGASRTKTALLKMVINIVSLSHSAGFTLEQVSEFKVPTDEEMIELIPIQQMTTPIVPTFLDSVEHFIEEMAGILEAANRTGVLENKYAAELVESLYLSMLYWFDAEWTHDFLGHLPSAMKSK